MARNGKFGTPMNTERVRKPANIACDCRKCRHSHMSAGVLYCEWFSRINPKEKYCYRFWDPVNDPYAKPARRKNRR